MMDQETCKAIIEEFEANSKEAHKVQREKLKRILEENKGVEYLEQFGLGGRTDEESFKSCIPVASYADFEPYIQRIIEGDTSPILTREPFTVMSYSSGTSGKAKIVPFNEKLLTNILDAAAVSAAHVSRDFEIHDGLALYFTYTAEGSKTKGGLDVRPISTNSFYLSKSLKIKRKPPKLCTPEEVIACLNHQEVQYCHLLCGIIYHEQVTFIWSNYCSTIVNTFLAFEKEWEELCQDIRTGTLNQRITDPTIRSRMATILKPDPYLADEIYKKCVLLKSRNWKGLVPVIWPNAKILLSILTGSMEPYVGKMKHYGGGIAVVGCDLVSSESMIGVNIKPRSEPESVVYAVVPDSVYLEFLPSKKRREMKNGESDGLKTCLLALTEVEVGEEYEVVITNCAGLYRYRLTDIVKVVGFHNSTPLLKFICRDGVTLNIAGEEVRENQLQLAVTKAAKILTSTGEEENELTDFTSYADVSTKPGHHAVFWELKSIPSEQLLKSCCDCIEQNLSLLYESTRRDKGLLGPLELLLVKEGTFEKIRNIGGIIAQYKTPRCVTTSIKDMIKILKENVIQNCFSTAFE